MKYFTYIPLLLLLGCSAINEQTGEEPLFDIQEVYCPPNTVKFCKGRSTKFLECTCVNKSSITIPDY